MLGGAKDTVITVNGVRIDSPPELDLEINISGKDFTAMSVLANELQRKVSQVEGVINVDSDL
ncbi:MAG: hypothetical protein GTO40_26590, partial [Deltaproteobacteria bacterium]|nr:hypothetical protein [Deltaproteobacteria bacterium]